MQRQPVVVDPLEISQHVDKRLTSRRKARSAPNDHRVDTELLSVASEPKTRFVGRRIRSLNWLQISISKVDEPSVPGCGTSLNNEISSEPV
jgi:hypothetical protein